MSAHLRSLERLFPDLGRRTHLMGVLNVTPDSFSDGGAFVDPGAALDHALAMMDAGADLIDVGGESTRPGSEPVSLEVELGRVLPVISALAARKIGPISIDTTKAEVAERALAAGAHIVNDVSALTFDPRIADVAAKAGAPLILMHTRGRPKVMQAGALEYPGGVVEAVTRALEDARAQAERAGVPRGSVVLDPGLGFGKTVEQNLELVRGLGTLARLGSPVLVGPSRKSFIGQLTGRDVKDRIFGTAAVVALAVAEGADFVRVHDVEAMGDVVRVADAVVRTRRE